MGGPKYGFAVAGSKMQTLKAFEQDPSRLVQHPHPDILVWNLGEGRGPGERGGGPLAAWTERHWISGGAGVFGVVSH